MADLERVLETFKSKLLEIWGNDLQSLLLYGSYLGPDFQPGRSDLNLMAVVRRDDPEKLFRSRRLVASFHRRRRLVPLFFTAEFLEESLDTFPVEFEAIRRRYRVLHGSDPVAGLSPSKADLRLQLEREIKENIIRFRQGILFGWEIPSLLGSSVKSMRILLESARLAFPGRFEDLETGHFEPAAAAVGRRRRSGLEVLAGRHLKFMADFGRRLEKEEK